MIRSPTLKRQTDSRWERREMFKKPTQFTIKRSRWGRGTGNGSLLKPSNGLLCCLGFYALACGATESQIVNTKRLSSPGVDLLRFLGDGVTTDRWSLQDQRSLQDQWSLQDQLMSVNDWIITVEDIPGKERVDSEEERERRITELFAGIDVSVTFED